MPLWTRPSPLRVRRAFIEHDVRFRAEDETVARDDAASDKALALSKATGWC
jgi:hypothetical protein